MNNECIDAPKLENFDYEQIFLSNCVLENAKSLVKATIHFDEHFACECPVHASRVTTLLLQICNVKCLSLAAHCLELSVCQLPAFANLSQLKLVLNACCSWWAEFLQRSPVLEYLVLDFDVFSSCGFESELVREYPHFQFKLPRVRWNPPDFVPSCLLTHLKTICITGLMGRPHEMEVAKFLLENVKVLEKNDNTYLSWYFAYEEGIIQEVFDVSSGFEHMRG
ncbi:FBD-associated F-box protein [Pyrus ussuriensis x Pyrus communis]|uniref:FBD-associated F-box protein n=1 Tax=Pyrus ussuriensis x Pyrus communis TaxID=2448454 RepID=A0A5N5HLX7_9ROSA|nr:FBD-associated F-box protein [Pyrus ussuriensis x Pyrus communis]